MRCSFRTAFNLFQINSTLNVYAFIFQLDIGILMCVSDWRQVKSNFFPKLRQLYLVFSFWVHFRNFLGRRTHQLQRFHFSHITEQLLKTDIFQFVTFIARRVQTSFLPRGYMEISCLRFWWLSIASSTATSHAQMQTGSSITFLDMMSINRLLSFTFEEIVSGTPESHHINLFYI